MANSVMTIYQVWNIPGYNAGQKCTWFRNRKDAEQYFHSIGRGTLAKLEIPYPIRKGDIVDLLNGKPEANGELEFLATKQ